MSPIQSRYDMVMIFDCIDGNPNGDPDAGNMPRIDPETLQGMVSDACLKRKLRDWVYFNKQSSGEPEFGYDIFFGHAGIPKRQVLNEQIKDAFVHCLDEAQRAEYDKLDEKKQEEFLKKTRKNMEASAYLCQTRFDIRSFGAVLSTGLNAGQVRGPVQCTFGRSVDPVFAMEAGITRKAVATEKQANEQLEKDGIITGTMGRKNLIPYGLFKNYWFISPSLAAQTGFSDEDFRLLCDGLINMFDMDRSAARGMMTTQALYVFKHDSAFGNARAQQLFDRIDVRRYRDDQPARSFRDYNVVFDDQDLPAGITVANLCDPKQYATFF